MTASASSRQSILDRIRAATQNSQGTPYADLPRNYIRRGNLDRAALLRLMVDRLREYGADVTETTPAELPSAVAEQLRKSGRRTFIVPPGLPHDWPLTGARLKVDRNLPHDEIETCDGVVTTAFAGIADSGTIALHHSATEGRRVLSLLPDWHLCILRSSQVVETLPEYFARCPQPPSLATYISGPSATADIEMTRIKGVHGPRFLNVILVNDEPPS
jgi:L-lactate dehydrogenase complex protein LldG